MIAIKPLVRLYDHVGLGLIVLAPSGVRFSNQTGGRSCLQPEVEGILVPLCNDLASSPVALLGPEPELEALFLGPKHRGLGATSGLDAADADQISAILAAHRLGGILAVDLTRLADSHEAWVHVHLLADDDPILTGFGPYPRPGILTWNNSD